MEVPEFGIAIRGRQLSRSAARTGERDVIRRWKQVQDVPRNNGKGTGKRGSDRAPMRLQCFCPRDGELIDKIALCLLYEAGVNEHAVISMICFLLSVWILLPFSKFRHGIWYLFMVFAILQVLITIFMFLLPEGGISAPIQF